MKVFKLEKRKVVVSENGITKVLNTPCGVSYSDVSERWNAWVLNEKDTWSSKSFSIRKHGAIEAFELAVEAREESLTFLLNRRLLPRIRRKYEIREFNNLFWVRDPIEKKYRSFSTKVHAEIFNKEVTEAWKEFWKFDKITMIQIENTQYKPAGVDSFTRQYRNAANQMGL